MSKKKIFIAIHSMYIGGAESSLIGLLQSMDYDKYDVDLFVYKHEGELLQHIPDKVNVCREQISYRATEGSIGEALSCHQYRVALALFTAKLKLSNYVKKNHPIDFSAYFGYYGKELSKVLPDINPTIEYDLAISFVTPHFIVRDHVRAKKKVCWIHTDYTKIDIDKELEFPMWNAYDNIVSISPDVTRAFLKVYPSFESKIVEIENILSPQFVESRANEFESTEYNHVGYTFCSVGRICAPKNYENIPYMAKALKELFESSSDSKGFHWFIVGPGEHEHIDKLAIELGVSDYITFLGPRSNPYPYIKYCDFYIHPSVYEGKSVVVREAQILKKPIIITDYPTAKSQIKDGIDGVITPIDNQKIAECIYGLTQNTELRKSLISYLQVHDYGNEAEINKIYRLIGE